MEVARQYAKGRKEWRAQVHMFSLRVNFINNNEILKANQAVQLGLFCTS